MIFTLNDGNTAQIIKRLTIKESQNSLDIVGDNDVYTFDYVQKAFKATFKAYSWCWTSQGLSTKPPAYWGLLAFGVGVIPSLVLCATAPSVPLIFEVLGAPVDGVISLGHHSVNVTKKLSSKKVKAANKLRKLVRGKDKKASKKVFESILKQVKAL